MIESSEVARLVAMMREHGLAELEVERDGVRVRVRLADPPGGAPVAAVAARPASGADPEVTVVAAPVVGTFYRAPAPDRPPFVEVGSRVARGDVLGLIEAMKLMNEITADRDGEVVEIHAENGQPVEYGQRLFAIRRPSRRNGAERVS